VIDALYIHAAQPIADRCSAEQDEADGIKVSETSESALERDGSYESRRSPLQPHPEYAPPAIFFAKGNLFILVTSFGRKPVAVLPIGQRLHSRLNEKPTGIQRPLSLTAEVERGTVRQDISLHFGLPIQKDPDGSVKLFVTGGTIFRRDGQLVLCATTTGVLAVEASLVAPGREAYAGRLVITIE